MQYLVRSTCSLSNFAYNRACCFKVHVFILFWCAHALPHILLSTSTLKVSDLYYHCRIQCTVSQLSSSNLVHRRVATCKPGKAYSFSETLALFFIQFLSFRKMKVQDRQNVNPGLGTGHHLWHIPGREK